MSRLKIEKAFESAIGHHQAGRLAQAEPLYRQVLAWQPKHAGALHYLGVMAFQMGRNDIGVDLMRRAIAAKPDYAEAHSNLGNALRAQGQLEEAVVACRRAIALKANNADAFSNLGNALKDKGQLEEAIAAYRRAIVLRPRFPEAFSNLGNALMDKGQLEEAVTAYRQAISLRPNSPQSYCNLGIALSRKGQLDEAIAAYRQAISLKSDFPDACGNLGAALIRKGQIDEAIAAYRQAISLRPNHADTYNNLGNALVEKSQLDEAIAAFGQAIALEPGFAEAYGNLGNALVGKGRLEEAIAACRAAISLKADYPEAHSNLGNALRAIGQLDEAIAAHRQAIALKPVYAEAYSNLGNALWHKGQLDEAIAAARTAVGLKPDFPEAYSNLGNALGAKGQLDEAIAAFGQALALKPNFAEAYNNLGNALGAAGQLDEAIAACRAAISLKPDFAEAYNNLLLTVHYHPGYDAQTIAREHQLWNRQRAEPLKQFIQPYANHRDPDRRLRIGYVSSDLRQHSVAYFLENLLAQHDPASVEVICYSDVTRPDATTARLQKATAQWRDIAGLNDAQVDQRVREDRVDILVDLSGHTANNRLLVFARKPAPVQVSYLGYPDTTGLTTIDYRLTDAYADPPGIDEESYSEQLVRLPETFLCYRPSDNAPAVGPLPARESGHVTFGSFNALAKINAPLVAMWSKILDEVPNSRLILKGLGMGTAGARQRILEFFAANNIAPDRVELIGWAASEKEHLQLYNRIDIALDTFPYHGTTTTCEAMWMGVPVVTLAGNAHVSRVGVSPLSNVGVPELIADSQELYVRLASDLAHDPARLSSLRSTLRQRMAQSPLMDAPRFARNVEAAYRQMWRTWCGT